MKKVIMTKGLPGSGKSTWAIEQVSANPGQLKRINKDALRLMLDNSRWSKHNEQFVLLMRDTMALSALEKGWSVIIDDTNLHPKHELHLRELAKTAGAEFEIKDFTDVSIEDCIKNDLKRYDSVGEKVIRDMHKQFLKPKIVPVQHDAMLPDAIICDLDGTLALFGNENPYERDFTQDQVNETVKGILLSCGKPDVKIIFVSGRKDKFKDQTVQWLHKNWGTNFILHMRKTAPEGEQEPKDVVVKKGIYEEHIKGKFNVLFVLDDRNQVVDLWRGLGLICLQVAEGDF